METKLLGNKIRVMHAVGSLNRGGIETWLMNLVRQGSNEMCFDFIVSTPGGTYEEEAKSYGCKIYYHHQTTRIHKRLEIFGLTKSPNVLEKVIKENKYDVFHAHGTEFLGDAVRTAFRCGVKVRVAHCHTTGIGRFRGNPEMWVRGLRFWTLDRHRILKYASDILAASSDAGRFFVSLHWDTDSRCKVLYCGVDLDPFDKANKKWTRDDFRRFYGIPSDAIVIGHAGSMWPNGVKNHFFLLKIFKELTKRSDRYYLYMAGDGPLRPTLEQIVIDMNLQNRVSLPGLCDDVPSLMIHGFDVHVLPSLYEGFPVVGMEATASGLFTVCSDTITKDFTEGLKQRVKSVSLKISVANWADEVEKAIAKRISSNDGMAIIRNGQFSIQASRDNLLDIYRHRLGVIS